MADDLQVVACADPAVQSTLRRKTGTEESPVDTRLRVAPDAKEWFTLGECNGPRVVFASTGAVKWVRRAPPGARSPQYFLTDAEVDALKDGSQKATIFSNGSDISPTFLDTFRRGCQSAMILPVDSMDGDLKLAECPQCGAQARWHSPKPLGAA